VQLNTGPTRRGPLRRAAWVLAPYLVIWGLAGGVVAASPHGSVCTDVCAVYVGSLTYTAGAVALLLSAAVTAVELALVAHEAATPDC